MSSFISGQEHIRLWSSDTKALSHPLQSKPIFSLYYQELVKTFQQGLPPEKVKLKRWGIYLSQFRLSVHHIQGIKNEILSIN